MFNYLLLCLFKSLSDQFNRRNAIYFKTMANCVLPLKNLEPVCGSECAAGGFVVCVCVCVWIMWL